MPECRQWDCSDSAWQSSNYCYLHTYPRGEPDGMEAVRAWAEAGFVEMLEDGIKVLRRFTVEEATEAIRQYQVKQMRAN
jgi:hypothetical protein